MLSINNVEVVYSDVILVLKGLSLNVDEGQIVALLGGNGAGKSTTLKAISGLLKSEEGEVTDGDISLSGKRIDGKEPEEIVRLGIFQVMEGRRVFEDLSVEENLVCGGYTRKDRKGIKERPKLMLLDEPSLGLSPLLVKEIFGIIKDINDKEGTTILLVEQNARVALSISDYGYIMENGKVVLDGEADKLIENEDVKEFYLGLTEVGSRRSYRDVKHYKRRKRWLS
jgi:branched-chain amino acid transport system ATP-binding protein